MLERNMADSLLSRFWASKGVPIDPAAIAASLGVPVRAFGADEIAAASGWYRHVEGIPTIFYNPTEVATRQRFTIAHELGHHVLNHGPRPRDGAAAFNLTNYDPVEASANRFAAELLMPEVAVKTVVYQKNVSSLYKLADLFRVSEVAMRYRLKNLGLAA